MKSKEYWEGRFIELQRSQLKRADSFAHELEDLHARMQKEIDDDITVWHKKVATANGISMADAKKLMSRKDRKEFQWTLEEYEQHAKADLLSGVTSANVMNASANWHLSYLDGMKLQLEHHVDKLYKNIDSKTRNHFKESLNENYLNTAFELQKGIGIGEKMEVPYDERKLENILRTPWASDGKNFSNRIWRDRTQLVNNLQKNLSESVIRGDSDTDMIQALSKDEKRAEFNTRRLVETESAYFDSLSEQECCEDFGVEKYRYLAVLDMKTSDICQELDNKVFLEKDRQVGVNAPPMHPFCRSTTAPVIDENFLTSRRAKNPKTGEYDEIPPEMNYKQWKEKYVEDKENVEEVKQKQVKTDTPNGNEFKTKPLEQKALEGETVHKDTAVPPKQQEEKEFNSEAYNNHVEEKANKQTINSSEEEARINVEIDKDLKKQDKELEKEVKEKQEEIQEQINQQTTTPVTQNVQPINTRTKEEILKDKAKNNIQKVLPHITKANINLNNLDENITQALNDVFVYLKVVQQDIQKVTGKLIEFTTINHIGSGDEYYDVCTNKFKRQSRRYFIAEIIKEGQKKQFKGRKIPLSIIKFNVKREEQNRIKKIERLTNRNKNSKTLAFTSSPTNGHINKDYVGIYINPDVVRNSYKNPYSQWKPLNCYNLKGTINHEIGHAIDNLLGLTLNNKTKSKIKQLYEQDLIRYKYFKTEFDKYKQIYPNDTKTAFKMAMKDAKYNYETREIGTSCIKKFGYDFDFLSQYSFSKEKEFSKALNNPERFKEFVAEAICEHLTSPTTSRPLAEAVWEIVIDAIKKNKNI